MVAPFLHSPARMLAFASALSASLVVSSAAADPPSDPSAQLERLHDRVASDLKAGRPFVAQVHVALCDNRIIRCGGHGLGNGDDPGRNLYWSSSGGMHGWMSRRGSGWSLAAAGAGDGVGVLASEIWKRSVAPSPPLRARGVTSAFDVYVVADAWRGTEIDEAVKAFASDLATVEARPRALPDGTTLASGGAAHLVAWVGHDRWMDYPRWTPPEPRSAAPPKGTMAIACMSRQYLGDFTSTPGRLPLLLTTDYLFAGSHAFEGALRAFLDGAALGAIADAGARAYATGQGKPYGRVRYAFITSHLHPMDLCET